MCLLLLPSREVMSKLLSSRHYTLLKVSCCAIAISLLGPSPATRYSFAQAVSFPESIVFWDGFEPPGDGEPEETSGAGSRDGRACTVDEPAIRPLMPARNFGLTLADHPTVFAHLPETSAKQVALIVTDEAGTYYERAFLPIPDGDIAAFSFPPNFAPLTVGSNYQWRLVVVCGETVDPDDPVLSGWIQRTARPFEPPRLSQRSPIEQAQWYAQNGYWYDLVNLVRGEVRSHPNNQQLQTLWQSVLDTGS